MGSVMYDQNMMVQKKIDDSILKQKALEAHGTKVSKFSH